MRSPSSSRGCAGSRPRVSAPPSIVGEASSGVEGRSTSLPLPGMVTPFSQHGPSRRSATGRPPPRAAARSRRGGDAAQAGRGVPEVTSGTGTSLLSRAASCLPRAAEWARASAPDGRGTRGESCRKAPACSRW